ncbi:MAG: hypothetical protein FWD31_10865, partial [Planctomycetaceae bacterium]|nr:hypothetical protein [Planctomycetaceae bacterium]
MSTLHLSDTLLNGYVALFTQLGPQDQTILLNKLTESIKEAPLKKMSREDVFGCMRGQFCMADDFD